IPAAARVGAASQNAPVGHPGLWLSLVDACSPALAGPFPAAGQLVPTRRLAPVDSESSPLSPSLGAGVGSGSPILPSFLAASPIARSPMSPGPPVLYVGGSLFGI